MFASLSRLRSKLLRLRGGKWVKFSFLVDSGADETFLHYRSIDILGIDISRIDVRDDVGGVGGYGVPYFRHPLELKLLSAEGNAIFSGDVNIFLDPHATRFPILGRDVLDNFIVLFDRAKNQVLLLREPDTYQIIRTDKQSNVAKPLIITVCSFEGDDILYIDTALGQEVRLDVMTFLRAWRSRGRRGIVVHGR